jgi:hypothetical protein
MSVFAAATAVRPSELSALERRDVAVGRLPRAGRRHLHAETGTPSTPAVHGDFGRLLSPFKDKRPPVRMEPPEFRPFDGDRSAALEGFEPRRRPRRYLPPCPWVEG